MKRATISLLLVFALTASSLLTAESASAQTVPKPSVPEFTIKYVDRSYTVPANYTYETNPYNGEQIEAGHGEYRVDNQTLEITIKNQPFTPYQNPDNGRTYRLCYNVSWKGHYEDTWNYWGYYRDSMAEHSADFSYYLHRASETEYTVFVFSLGTNRESTLEMPNLGKLPKNTTLDFRVQALFGYYTEAMYDWAPPFRPSYKFVFTGESSDWSSTQTIDLSAFASTQPAASPQSTAAPTETASTTPTTTSAQPDTQTASPPQLSWEQTAILALTAAVVVLLVGMGVLLRKVTRLSAKNVPPEPPPPT